MDLPEIPPQYYDINNLGKIDKYDIIWWDEVHHQVAPGTSNGESVMITSSKKVVPRYPRDADGKYDPKGKISEANINQMQVKYNNEARFCLGVGAREVNEDDVCSYEGFRVKLFDYTSTVILSVKDYEKKIAGEIIHVKTLQHGGEWTVIATEDGDLFMDDPLEKLCQCAKKTAQKLRAAGIKSMKDLIDLKDDCLPSVPSVGVGKMRLFRE